MVERTNFDGRDSVRALVRGLDILRYINSVGETKAGAIARALDLPRPTVYRLIETLEEQGYIAMSATSNRIRVTRLSASLGDGYVKSRICEVAGPLLSEYAGRLVWPIDVSVYDDAAMVIQETTHGSSPLSIDRGMIGCRLPMLRSAAGRCYLGHCNDRERELILEHIRRLNSPQDVPLLEDRFLSAMLAGIAERGIAIRESGEFRPRTASFAIPVMSGRTVAACVSVIWIHNAIPLKQALADCEDAVREIAQKISVELAPDAAAPLKDM